MQQIAEDFTKKLCIGLLFSISCFQCVAAMIEVRVEGYDLSGASWSQGFFPGGESVEVVFHIDTLTPPSASSPNWYPRSVTQMQLVTSGGYTLSGSSGHTTIRNDQPPPFVGFEHLLEDSVYISTLNPLGDPVAGYEPVYFDVAFTYGNTPVFSSSSLQQLSQESLNLISIQDDSFWNVNNISIHYQNQSSDDVWKHFSVRNVSYTVIPLPATAWLFLSALAGIVGMRKLKTV